MSIGFHFPDLGTKKKECEKKKKELLRNDLHDNS